MNFKEWLINEKTLYHGTVVDNFNTIKKYGLDADWHDGPGPLVQSAYEDLYGRESDKSKANFFADKSNMASALSAMVYHIGLKLGKDFHDVTDADILSHGLIIKYNDDGNQIQQHDPYNWKSPDAIGAEEGDYLAFDNIKPNALIVGKGLLKLLRYYKVWPRTYGKDNDLKAIRAYVVSQGIKMGQDKDYVLKITQDPVELMKMYKKLQWI